MSLNESGEMYLETIHVLSKKLSAVRSIDIANFMHYSKPSVSRAMGILKKENYISIDSDGYITLTESGHQVADGIYEKHTVLRDALMALGIDEDTATEDACRIEHIISEESFLKIKKHLHEKAKMPV